MRGCNSRSAAKKKVPNQRKPPDNRAVLQEKAALGATADSPHQTRKPGCIELTATAELLINEAVAAGEMQRIVHAAPQLHVRMPGKGHCFFAALGVAAVLCGDSAPDATSAAVVGRRVARDLGSASDDADMMRLRSMALLMHASSARPRRWVTGL